MNLLCPNCQKMLQVPEQYAGQMMKCPLCAGTFTVPATAPSAPMPPPPPPPPPPPSFAPPEPPQFQTGHGATSAPAPENLPPAPPAGYEHVYSILLRPESIRWIAPLALIAVFVLWFLPWLEVPQTETTQSQSAWNVAFGENRNGLSTLYGLVFMLAFVAAMASMFIHFVPPANLPPALNGILPWRSMAVAAAALGAFVLVVLLNVAGFGTEAQSYPTRWQSLAIFCHLLAALGAGLEFWLSVRGPQKPTPRIDFSW